MLMGRIVRAQLYDRALTSEEVEASSKGTGKFVSNAKVLAALAVEERKRIKLAHQTIERLEKQLVSLGPIPDSGNTKALWADLANALFNFKEFIYRHRLSCRWSNCWLPQWQAVRVRLPKQWTTEIRGWPDNGCIRSASFTGRRQQDAHGPHRAGSVV